MADETLIAWTDHTFNPWMGCLKISPGCKNCYAATMTKNRMGLDLWGPPETTTRQRTKGPWQHVKKWNNEALSGVPGLRGAGPHLVFTGSLMDWAEDHPILDAVRSDMWNLIRQCQSLHFQLLTKRTDRIEKLLPEDWGDGYPNVWLGTSVENMDYAWRADILRRIPATVRFISYEPALGSLKGLDLIGIDWVIYGGESGAGYRPEDKQWARDMRDACAAERVAFFHKQSAAYRTEMGIELDGEIIRQFPTPRPVGLGAHAWSMV